MRKALATCRAVKASIGWTAIDLPDELVDVIYSGSRTFETSETTRTLTIAGFLVPEKTAAGVEFMECDWNKDQTKHGMANPLMSEYYKEGLSSRYASDITDSLRPQSGSDLLARAFPYMTLSSVVDNAIRHDGSPLSSADLPCENHYNKALCAVYRFNLGYKASAPENTAGNVDLVVEYGEDPNQKTCAVETIMAHWDLKSHDEHIGRFTKTEARNHCSANSKVLLTIGSEKEDVVDRVQNVQKVDGVEVVGLVVSRAHDGYEWYVWNAPKNVVGGPFFLACDGVAKSYHAPESELGHAFASVQKKRKLG